MSVRAFPKPTKLPRWGTDQTNETEASEGQKDTGWTFKQIPPSSFQNFLQRVTHDHLAWFDERFGDDTFGGGSAEDGFVLREPVTQQSTDRGVTKIFLSNPIGGSVRIAAIAITNDLSGGATIQATGAQFVTNNTELNDIVELVGTNANDGFYLVSVITDEDNIDVRRLSGGGVAFATEVSIQGTVKVFVRGAASGDLVAPGGWQISEREGGKRVTLRKRDGVGDNIDWIYPDTLPAAKSFLFINENGQLSTGADNDRYTIFFGATFTGAQTGSHCRVNGEADSSRQSALNEISEFIVPLAGTIVIFGFNTETADATTDYRVVLNGTPGAVIELTGTNGTVVVSIAVAVGDRLAIEYDAGTAPGNGNFSLLIES